MIEKYDVNGIPKLIFFDDKGVMKGFSLGVRKYNELNEIFLSLINNSKLPSFTKESNSSNLSSEFFSKEESFNNIIKTEAPRNHS